MANTIKLAVPGGSSVATPELIRALGERAERPPMEWSCLGVQGTNWKERLF